jgi:hypothetical protein
MAPSDLDRPATLDCVSRVLPLLILIGLTIFTLVTVAQSNAADVRHIPRWLWFIIVLILPVVGLGLWWIFGRPLPDDPSAPAPPRPVAPDDDPEFLRGL